MTRGPTFWIVVLAIAGATAGLYLEHRRLNPPPPSGVTVAGVGDVPESVSWATVDGRPRRLSDWHGRRVLINFWATWCAPCRREMPMLSAAGSRDAERKVAIVGVAEDTASNVRGYLANRPVSYPVLLADPDTAGSSLAFGNTRRVLPYSVLVGEDGRILRHKTGALTPSELDDWLAP